MYPRIAEAARRALVDARTVVNIGAGSYEPTDRPVIVPEIAERDLRGFRRSRDRLQLRSRVMAVLHQATITPTKDQLVGPWVRTRPWWDGIAEREPVGAFRLDDPAGEVGIECFLFGSAEGSTLFVPITYRGAELRGGDSHLVGTMEHSVLGHRWVYDGCGDPVFVTTLVNTIRDAGTQADLQVHREDGTVELRESSAHVSGSGADLSFVQPDRFGAPVDELARTLIDIGGATLSIARQVGVDLPTGPRLVGSFAGGAGLVLATVS